MMTNDDRMVQAAKRLGVEVDGPLQDDAGRRIGEFNVTLYGRVSWNDNDFRFPTFREAWNFAERKMGERKSVSKVSKVLW